MNLHKIRENETLNDLSQLYSIDEKTILSANDNEKPIFDMEYIIPVTDGFYYFLKREEKVSDVLQKYNVSMEEFMKKNREVLKFKDGTVRVFIPLINKRRIDVSSIVSLSLKSDIFIESDLESEYINLVIHLDKIASLEEYDRLGSMDNTHEILGVSLPKINVPVLAGRNVAVIVEVATRNFRLKKQGYNALDELKKRTNLK